MKNLLFLAFLAISVVACDTPEPASGGSGDSTINNNTDTSGMMQQDTTTTMPDTTVNK